MCFREWCLNGEGLRKMQTSSELPTSSPLFLKRFLSMPDEQETSKVKGPTRNPGWWAPKFVLGFITRATLLRPAPVVLPRDMLRGIPCELLGENFANWVGGDEGVNAWAGCDFAGVREVAEDDMKAVGSFFDGGFGEAGGLEEPSGDRGVAGGVEGGRGFRFVGSGGGVGVEGGGGADLDFKLVEGACGFDDGVSAER